MSRKTVQLLAVVVLVILGTPLAMHVVLHDLHGHHVGDPHHEEVALSGGDHDPHEHPLVTSASTQLPRLTQSELPVAAMAASVVAPSLHSERDSFSFRALRLDDDVGLQALLSTFLI